MLATIKRLSGLIEKRINQLDLGQEPPELYDPIYYILSLEGKRIRPLLTLLSYSLYKNDTETIIDQALAVEVFHNFTLMHDDIMDEAPLRRGKTTVHEKWDASTAILSGDVMLIKAYDLLLSTDSQSLKSVITGFNQCATEVCEGQQMDMNFEQLSDVSAEEYLEMIKLKTAVLLGFSLELGAILAGAPEKDQLALRQFGIMTGIGFQLMDDLLDVYADKAKFGKQVGGDIIANKKTLLLIEAMNLANPKQKKTLNEWLKKTKFNPEEKVKAVMAIYNELDIKGLTELLMNQYFEQGLSKLHMLSAPMPRISVLQKFMQSLINREK